MDPPYPAQYAGFPLPPGNHLPRHTNAAYAAGTLTDSYGYGYDAFGNGLERTGGSAQPYRFAGEYFDPVAGMQYHRARWYAPEVGRFVAMDMFSGYLRRPVTLNKYAYVENDPVGMIDPSGKFGMASVSFSAGVLFNTAINVAFWVGAYATGGQSALASAIVEDLAFMLIPGSGISNAGKKIAQIFARSRKFKLGYAPSGAVLADNLRVFGRYGPNAWPAHHIVAGTDKRAQDARAILAQCGIDINSPINGIFLDPKIHASLHTDRYYRLLKNRIENAWNTRGKEGVRDELTVLYQEIYEGLFP